MNKSEMEFKNMDIYKELIINLINNCSENDLKFIYNFTSEYLNDK